MGREECWRVRGAGRRGEKGREIGKTNSIINNFFLKIKVSEYINVKNKITRQD